MRFFSSLAFASFINYRRRITNSYDVTNSQPPLPGLHSLVYLLRFSLACTRNSEHSFEWSATEEMKRIYKSGAQKRKEAKALKEKSEKLVCPKVTNYFTQSRSAESGEPASDTQDTVGSQDVLTSTSSEQPSAQPSAEAFNELTPRSASVITSGDDIPMSDDLDNAASSWILSSDPADWPERISYRHRCDLVQEGPKQVNIDFPYNEKRRTFSKFFYKRCMKNEEKVLRKWIVYSLKKDYIVCFCCKLFATAKSPFTQGMSTWEGLSKKLEEHDKGSTHLSCLSKWEELYLPKEFFYIKI